ncbi:putative 2Fe-2S ferredoxin [Caenibius tardaugens NBRC 16725]|uniref:Putative 2Fe-2S ferredoxin n=1 Tax=Caenibius tardaugens NBRC 16725 TaxID=1219035 RepID=U2YAT1_9SPHN|nr:2Fe-2S iron-sulfur cluster-binding protein [Caenibius tardaugens]AZI35377.1 (2Fe-2S)-binding protein [Caenibius tardaugens NBRC 16725]GAD50541.1 putative 2Fe-2S ferredoxin [Caenibius tardaugens NBRC 16725]
MQVRFIDPDGGEHLVHAEAGESAMRCATRALIPGIIGECGGAMACATCHCYAEPPEGALLPPPEAQERDMIEGCIDTRPTSRLTCQVILEPALDGMTFIVPASQV